MNTLQSKTQSNQVNQNYLSFLLLVSLSGSTSRGSMSLDYPFSPNKTGILTQVSRTIVPFISAIPHLLTFQLTSYRILVCIKKIHLIALEKHFTAILQADTTLQLLLFKG